MLAKILAVILLPLSFLFSMISKPVEPEPLPECKNETEPEVTDKQTFDRIEGDNNVFYIKRPDAENLNTVHTSDFGMTSDLADCTDAFNAAVDYCRNTPGTELVIDEGIYNFRESGRIILDRLDTCLISGENAKFIFCSTGTFFTMKNCRCTEIAGLTVDVDRAGNPVDDVFVVKNADKKNHRLDFVFFEKTDIDENMILSAVTQCDPETLTFGAKGSNKECYIYMNPDVIKKVEKTAANVLTVTHSGTFDSFDNGDTFILRHHVYDGCVFNIDNSHDITFDGLKIYGSYGAGFGPAGLSSHFQIINTFIGVDPDDKTGAHVSLGADAIHICNTGGYFNLEGCDISGQGDDALNIHDGLGYVYEVDGCRIKMYASAARLEPGEKLAFKDGNFNETGFSAKIVSVDKAPECSTSKLIVFDEDVSDKVRNGYIAYNTLTNSGNYVIKDNYFHENRARALLLQSDNGLCEDNRFYKVQGQAIKIVMDIIPSLWQEGTGVNNLAVRNNVFDGCDYSRWGEQITINTNIDGHTADCFAFRNIDISGNTFRNFDTKIINAMNVNGLSFTENSIEASSAENRIYFGEHCANVSLGNDFSGPFAETAAIVKTSSLADFITLNGKKC